MTELSANSSLIIYQDIQAAFTSFITTVKCTPKNSALVKSFLRLGD